jgi:hypothetical protein
MGKAKPFIDKANARHFHLVNRQHNPLGEAHGAQAHDTDEVRAWAQPNARRRVIRPMTAYARARAPGRAAGGGVGRGVRGRGRG